MIIDSPTSVDRYPILPAHPPEIAQLEALLQSNPAVFEAVVRERMDRWHKPCLVSYVQPIARCTAQMLLDHIARTNRSCRAPHCIVFVSTIPRDVAGAVDEEALGRFEVVDDTAAAEFERTVLNANGLPEAAPAAVVVAERQPQRRQIGIADLMPPLQRRFTSADQSEPASSDSPLAIIHGASLNLPPQIPPTLSGVLQRAAIAANGSIVHVGSEGVPITQSYRQLLCAARRVLSGLHALGLQPGQQVLLQLERTDDYLAGFWGCILGGFVPVPVSIATAYQTDNATVQRLKHAWEMLDRPAILSSASLVSALKRVAPSLE